MRTAARRAAEEGDERAVGRLATLAASLALVTSFAFGAATVFASWAGAAHSLYVANGSSRSVSAFTITPNGSLSPVAGSPVEVGIAPVGVAVSPDAEHLYVTNLESNTISAFTIAPSGGLNSVPGSPFATSAGPWGVAVGPDGERLYVVNRNADKVSAYSIASDGSLSPVAGSPFVAGATARPVSVTPDGKYLYVGNATAENISVYSIGSDGVLGPIAGSPFATEGGPLGLAVTPDGTHLYTAHIGWDPNVWGYSIASSGALSPVPGTPFPTGGFRGNSAAVSPDGKHLYSTNNGSHDLSAYSIAANGSLSALAGSPFATQNGPLQVVVTPDQGPVAAFSASPTPAGNPLSFDASASSDPDGSVASYHWDFGDGQTKVTSAATIAHIYASAGEYTVTLTVTDDSGCSTTQTFTGQTVSCNGSPPAQVSHLITVPPGVPLSVSPTGSGSGSVASSPSGVACPDACSYFFVPDTQVTLAASPALGSTFTGWSGDGCSGTGSTCEVSMSESRIVEAEFTINTHSLAVITGGTGSGEVFSSPAGISKCGMPTGACQASFDYGTVVTLTASPAPGSTFTGWSGGGCLGTATCQVPLGGDTEISVNFSKTPPPSPLHSLTVQLAGGGSGSVEDATGAISCPPTCAHSYVTGTQVTLAARSAPGSKFVGWSGNGCVAIAGCPFTVDADTTLTASFEKVPRVRPRLRIERVGARAFRPRCRTRLAFIIGLLGLNCAQPGIVVGGTIVKAAHGSVTVEVGTLLKNRRTTATRRTEIRDGHWRARLPLASLELEPGAAVRVTARFKGSPGVQSGHTRRRVKLGHSTS